MCDIGCIRKRGMGGKELFSRRDRWKGEKEEDRTRERERESLGKKEKQKETEKERWKGMRERE